MVLKLRKLLESFNTKSAAKQEDSGRVDELDDNVIDAEDVRVTEVISLEDMVAEKTKDLEDAREQIRQLSNTAYTQKPARNNSQVKEAIIQALNPQEGALKMVKLSELDKEEIKVNEAPASAQPRIELAVQSLKISPDDKEEAHLKDAEAQLRPVEVKLPEINSSPEVKTAISSKKIILQEKATKNEEAADMISKIFNREDAQDNPLAGLAASLPGATMRELLDDAAAIKTMLREWQ